MFTIVSGVHILLGVLVTWCWLPGHCCHVPAFTAHTRLPGVPCVQYTHLHCTYCTLSQFLVSGDTGPLELGSCTTVSSRPHHIQDTGEKLLVSITRYLYHLELISANYNCISTVEAWMLGYLQLGYIYCNNHVIRTRCRNSGCYLLSSTIYLALISANSRYLLWILGYLQGYLLDQHVSSQHEARTLQIETTGTTQAAGSSRQRPDHRPPLLLPQTSHSTWVVLLSAALCCKCVYLEKRSCA